MDNEIERVRDALDSIPPDLPRDEWVKVGMALHAAGGSFDDFDRWSAGGASYNALGCRADWRSFKSGRGIGAGSLFFIARQYGYGAGARHQPSPLARPPEAAAKSQMGGGCYRGMETLRTGYKRASLCCSKEGRRGSFGWPARVAYRRFFAYSG